MALLQLVIRKLKDGGRCGTVVPNGVLFAEGVGARINFQRWEAASRRSSEASPDERLWQRHWCQPH